MRVSVACRSHGPSASTKHSIALRGYPISNGMDHFSGDAETALNVVIVTEYKNIAVEADIGQFINAPDKSKTVDIATRFARQGPSRHFLLIQFGVGNVLELLYDGLAVQNYDPNWRIS